MKNFSMKGKIIYINALLFVCLFVSKKVETAEPIGTEFLSYNSRKPMRKFIVATCIATDIVQGLLLKLKLSLTLSSTVDSAQAGIQLYSFFIESGTGKFPE